MKFFSNNSRCHRSIKNVPTQFSYQKTDNKEPSVNRLYAAALRKSSRATMMRGPGPPPPLGLFPNGINVDQPAYSFDTDEWKATPNLQNESFRNEKSVSDREQNDSSYVLLVGNKTTWHKYNALGYHCYDDCFQFESQWDRMIQSESDTLTFIWAMYTYHCNKFQSRTLFSRTGQSTLQSHSSKQAFQIVSNRIQLTPEMLDSSTTSQT